MAKKSPAKKSSSKSAPGKTAPKKTPPGKATKKSLSKSPAKKIVKKKTAPVKKAAKKAPDHKAVTKKAAKKEVPSQATSKPASARKAPSKTAVSKPVKKPVKTADSSVSKSKPVKKKSTAVATRTRAGKTEGQNATKTEAAPGIRLTSSMKGRVKKVRRSAFTLDDVREIAKRNEKNESKAQPKSVPVETTPTTTIPDLNEIKQEKRVLGAASLADILGYNPDSKTPREDEEKRVPKKHIRYYRLLIQLREHVNSELTLHTEDTLKRSSKEDSGDLSGYSQHIADAGTDTFDRDFALSLVSSEQEALHEVEEAINRIKTGTFGICELTGKPIAKERLLAVPFARYSVESQAQMEKTMRRNVQRGGIFADATAEDSARFTDDDSDG
jgi:RNA polymerase-binding transcription factor DksA